MGRAYRQADWRGGGYDLMHSVVDDHSRLPYSKILPGATGETSSAFYARAHVFFAAHVIDIQAVMTDNAFAYTKAVALRQTLTDLGVKHVRLRPSRPETNGKVERFNRNLLEKWAHVRTHRYDQARSRALDRFSNPTITTEPTSLGGPPPMTRVNNAPRHYT